MDLAAPFRASSFPASLPSGTGFSTPAFSCFHMARPKPDSMFGFLDEFPAFGSLSGCESGAPASSVIPSHMKSGIGAQTSISSVTGSRSDDGSNESDLKPTGKEEPAREHRFIHGGTVRMPFGITYKWFIPTVESVCNAPLLGGTEFDLERHECRQGSKCPELTAACQRQIKRVTELAKKGVPDLGAAYLTFSPDEAILVSSDPYLKPVHEGEHRLPIWFSSMLLPSKEVLPRPYLRTIDFTLKRHDCTNSDTCDELKAACEEARKAEEDRCMEIENKDRVDTFCLGAITAFWTLASKIDA